MRRTPWLAATTLALLAAVAFGDPPAPEGNPPGGPPPQGGRPPQGAPPSKGGRPPRGEPTGGPWVHRVLSATSTDGLTFTRDEGVRWAHASVPCVVADGDRLLLYAVDADRGPGQPESANVSVSTDGLRFEKQTLVVEGMTSRKALDPCVVRDPAGGFRLYYLGADADGDPARAAGDHAIHVARSEDGVRFREVGVALARPALVDPDVFFFGGTWFCHVFGRGRTELATSKDGLTFAYERDLDLDGFGTVAPVLLDDGRLRLYAFEQRKPAGNAFVSFVSTDGRTWTREEGVRLQGADDEQVTDPYVVRWKGGWRMYFKSEPRRRGEGPPPQGGPDERAARGPRGGPRGPGGDAPPFDGQGRPNRRRSGPWDHDVLVAKVARDGATTPKATFPRAGVPTLARLADGRLLAATQHFPADDDAAFDKVAVRTSSDDGATWSAPEVIRVEGLPEGLRFPFDPTLVPLPDGHVRLYFTANLRRGEPGGKPPTPSIGSAVSKDGTTFVYEPGARFAVEGRPVIDCAVVLHRGVFHLFAPDNGTGGPPRQDAPSSQRPRSGVGYHATSKDGLVFERQPDVTMDGPLRWLGNAQSDGDTITFLGTADGGLWSASSADGTTWTSPTRWTTVAGADPGFVRLSDGAWLVVFTGPPREDARRRGDGPPETGRFPPGPPREGDGRGEPHPPGPPDGEGDDPDAPRPPRQDGPPRGPRPDGPPPEEPDEPDPPTDGR